MAKWTSIKKLAETAGKNVDEMTDILKGAGHTFSKSGKSVLGRVSDKVFFDTRKVSNITEDAIKSARKTKIIKGKPVGDVVEEAASNTVHLLEAPKIAGLLPDVTSGAERTVKDLAGKTGSTIENVSGGMNDRVLKNRARNAAKETNLSKVINIDEDEITKTRRYGRQNRRSRIAQEENILNKAELEFKKGNFDEAEKLLNGIPQRRKVKGRGTVIDKETQELLDSYSNSAELGKANTPIGKPKTNKVVEEPATRGIDFSKNSLAMKVAGYGVGGGLVLSLANSRGQQSNQQLYGQG